MMEQGSQQEESGWTMYFEDLCENNNHGDCNYSSSMTGVSSSSLLSDAASGAAWKMKNQLIFPPQKPCKPLNFKKRKTAIPIHDDPLEDTASSPANSPKEKDDVSGNFSEFRAVEKKEPQTEECTDLKKRGLCLMPLSMLVDYLS
ncbi:uncharacterized protein LOC18421469 isoform X2 [Amborella trichopoda]|uniref:uncharacterized protein LOC18421469 isoform X2 n=1 Tax=Amborella trichopoda TaxID=13333 RepID=UPI0009BF3CD9|nr:uncharacterized protein LOC18421469 isoform X2 [Amborella trichopoda]|eukprot:XP_020517261.1 uncharacterized protein LOC18421469 isoform X2 [Amborella trichopoda]